MTSASSRECGLCESGYRENGSCIPDPFAELSDVQRKWDCLFTPQLI